jgi:hypothetical protein
MNHIWLLRAARWARNPPSSGRVKLVLGVILVCLVLAGIEYFRGWPDFLTVNKSSHRGMIR